MNPPSAESSPLPAAPDAGWLAGPKPPSEEWSPKKFYFVLAFVLLFHVALIFLFGTKKQIVPRVVADVPHLQLAGSADEFVALGDPTLFARPNPHDLATAFWRRPLDIAQPNFNYTEAPGYRQPAAGDFGVAFREYMRGSESVAVPLDFKPEPKLVAPELPPENSIPQVTTMQLSSDLAQRQLLHQDALPSLPFNDVIQPSRVQALVDTGGDVSSAVVLESSDDPDADVVALRLAQNLRFAPGPNLTLGEITFVWHTVPTNAVPANPP